MFTVGLAFLLAGYTLVYVGGLNAIALGNGGLVPGTVTAPPSFADALGFSVPQATNNALKPVVTNTAFSTTNDGGASSTTGDPNAPGPITIMINGKPIAVPVFTLPPLPIGPAQPSPTAGITTRAL